MLSGTDAPDRRAKRARLKFFVLKVYTRIFEKFSELVSDLRYVGPQEKIFVDEDFL